jgi:D-alanine transaminase
MPELLYMNGKYMPLSEGRIPVEERGFQLSDGVYDAVRVYNGFPFAMRQHLERLQRSAAGIWLELSHSIEELEKICRKLLEDSNYPECLIYIQVTRGTAKRKHPFPDVIEPLTILYTREFTPHLQIYRDKGIKVIFLPDNRWNMCNIKAICLLPNVLAKETAHRQGAYEAVFYGPERQIWEGCSSNVYCIIGDKLITAPEGPKILAGVTRSMVFGVAGECGLTVEQRAPTVEEFMAADEAFVTSSTMEIMPVTMAGDQLIGTGRVGPYTTAMYNNYMRKVAATIA